MFILQVGKKSPNLVCPCWIVRVLAPAALIISISLVVLVFHPIINIMYKIYQRGHAIVCKFSFKFYIQGMYVVTLSVYKNAFTFW